MFTHYRIYSLDSEGHFKDAVDAKCCADEDAYLAAREIFGADTNVEIWAGSRVVALLSRSVHTRDAALIEKLDEALESYHKSADQLRVDMADMASPCDAAALVYCLAQIDRHEVLIMEAGGSGIIQDEIPIESERGREVRIVGDLF